MILKIFLCLIQLTFSEFGNSRVNDKRSFEVDHVRNEFSKDGKSFRILSGSFHYFRVHSERWDHVMKQAKAMGLNTIESYLPWSLHEPSPGQYDFNDRLDFFTFSRLAQKNGLLVIARVGPYSCAEMDMGGLPAWLKNKTEHPRTSDPSYMKEVNKWLEYLLPLLTPMLYKNGGPIIMVQMENEYGSYGCDSEYLKQLENIFRKHLHYDAILFTVDGCSKKMLKCGGIDTVFRAPDFGPGTNVKKCFETFREFQKTGPMVVMEYYTGWFTYWGGSHVKTNGFLMANTIDDILSHGHSVNLYMFMGGTNYGLLDSGAQSFNSHYAPQITSYEYDGPLDEIGNPSYKFYILRRVFKKFHTEILPLPEKIIERLSQKRFNITRSMSLLDALKYIQDDCMNSTKLTSMDELQYYTGFVMYSTNEKVTFSNLTYQETHDSFTFSINQTALKLFRRSDSSRKINIQTPLYGNVHLTLHNEGRPNYGYNIYDVKEILNLKINDQFISNWKIRPFLKNDAKIRMLTKAMTGTQVVNAVPGFYQFSFSLTSEEILDTYVGLNGFYKGMIYVNDKSIGRYDYPLGPQYTFYVPQYYFKVGRNQILIFETMKADCFGSTSQCQIYFTNYPVWSS